MVAQKIGTFLYALSSNIDLFSNFFIVRITRKLVIVVHVKIPPSLECVATLPCEMSLS